MFRSLAILILVFGLISSRASAENNSAPYYIPPGQFNAALQVMELNLANVFALFQNATGSFTFDPDTKSISNLRLALDATSLMSNNKNSQRDLGSLLNVSAYPEIRLTSLEGTAFTDGKADLKTTLTLHGVSKPITLQATLNGTGKSPHGGGMWASEGDAVGISLHGSFNRADFGMGDDPETPGRFGDMITLMLEAQAIKQ